MTTAPKVHERKKRDNRLIAHIVAETGFGFSTVEKFLRGESVNQSTRTAIERALGTYQSPEPPEAA